MRICVLKANGRLLEMQSHARAGTLIANAVRAGHAETDVEERVVTAAEYAALVAAQPPAPVEIKARAGALILTRYPAWRQQNMTARAVELLEHKRQQGLDAAQSNELAAIRSAWDWIKAVRARSDAIEAAVAAGQAVDLETGAIAGAGGWPD